MAIGTALGFSNWGTVALAVVLAFLFGYTLTSVPLLRAGLALSAVIPIALASDTLSIAVMEIVDNLVVLVIPGAIDAGLDSLLFWGSLSFALAVAFVVAVPVNRWLIGRGKGHAAVHRTGIHGGPDPRGGRRDPRRRVRFRRHGPDRRGAEQRRRARRRGAVGRRLRGEAAVYRKGVAAGTVAACPASPFSPPACSSWPGSPAGKQYD